MQTRCNCWACEQFLGDPCSDPTMATKATKFYKKYWFLQITKVENYKLKLNLKCVENQYSTGGKPNVFLKYSMYA